MKKYIFTLLIISCLPYIVMAQVKLETGLPNIPGAPEPSSGLPGYIGYLFIFGLIFIAFVALVQMTIGGITYILAAGNAAKVEDAKDTIKQALIGLLLLLVSYLLLVTINPDLVNLKNPNLTPSELRCAPGNCPADCDPGCPDNTTWDQSICTCQANQCTPGNCPGSCETACPDNAIWNGTTCSCEVRENPSCTPGDCPNICNTGCPDNAIWNHNSCSCVMIF